MPLGFFYASCLLAFVAGHTMNYATIIYAQDILGSDLLAGIGFGLCFGPPLVLGWFAGVLCDRLAPRTVIVWAQTCFILAGGLLWAGDAMLADAGARAGALLCGAFLAGCGWAFVAPARLAALGQIVPSRRLHASMVLLNLLIMLGFGAAPIVIALARGAFGWGGVFAAVIAGFALASVALLPVPSHPVRSARRRVRAEIEEGFAAVAAAPILGQLLLAAVLIYALIGPMQVLLPRLAGDRLALAGLERGLFLGTLAMGLILGGVACMALRTRLHDGRTILSGVLAAGAGVALLANMADPLPAAAVLLLAGAVGGMVASLVVAGLQAETPGHVRGRVMSMYTIASQIVPAASGVAAGALSEALGLVGALTLCGLAVAAGALVAAGRLAVLRSYRHAG